MKGMRITITLRPDQAATLQLILSQCPNAHCSHGELTPAKLVMMLVEDVLATETRPGSWEGANMDALLQAHGY